MIPDMFQTRAGFSLANLDVQDFGEISGDIRFYMEVSVPKQYSLMDTGFKEFFGWGTPEKSILSLQIQVLVGWQAVCFMIFSIDVFLDAQAKDIVKYCI